MLSAGMLAFIACPMGASASSGKSMYSVGTGALSLGGAYALSN